MTSPAAQAAKEKGNTAFKAGDYPTAIGHYTTAILADRADPTYPLNRAAAYLKLGKAEDAERDCSIVLGLNPKNVKALFRRGQARVGINKLLEAHKDFSDILVAEPSNAAAQDELKKVVDLIQVEKAKKAKSPVNAMSSSLEPKAATKRRRVPIKIVDSTLPAASSSPTEYATQLADKPAPITPKAGTDTLQAASSRSLKLEAPIPPAPTQSSAPVSNAAESKTPPNAEPSPSLKASSFKDVKQARETVKPSRIGGGIFRASGQNTFFTLNADKAAASSPKSPPIGAQKPEPSIAAQSQAPVTKAGEKATTSTPPTSIVTVEAPASLFDFNKAWTNARSTEEKWQLINTISPTQFPGFCKSSMEAGLLSSILSMFVDVSNTGEDKIKATVLAYMESFPKIARFNTIVLFFSRAEKAVAKKVWELLGVEKPTGAWAPVA